MPLSEMIDRLAAFEPIDLPVISLYLNAQADQHGRDNFDSFVRKEFKAKSQTFPVGSPARLSFDKDSKRIKAYLEKLRPSANVRPVSSDECNDQHISTLGLPGDNGKSGFAQLFIWNE